MEKLILTGSRGLIGKALVPILAEKYEVIEVDLSLGHDLSREEFVKGFFSKNKAKYLVNLFALNDHICSNRDVQNIYTVSLDSFNDYLHVNLTSLFSVCREHARNNPDGVIVNFSSTYGVVPPVPSMYKGKEKHIGYPVSKAGVIMLSKFLAVHLAPKIRVNCIVPGGVESSQSDEFKEEYSLRTPLQRMMRASELAGAIEYLCSGGSSYVTGSVIFVDGGWTTW
jgi:NAD(P)-dependent dehydrogenase (short-subunit alcohol dehydrogenase family)